MVITGNEPGSKPGSNGKIAQQNVRRIPMKYQANKKILLVDDELNILKSLKRLISAQGYDVSTTVDPQQAIAWVTEQNFGVVISDFRMAAMTGTELLTKVRAQSPNSLRILLTGYADVGAAIEAVNHSQIYKYLTKPWSDENIKQVLLEAFRQYNLQQENQMLQIEVQRTAVQLQKMNQHLEQLVLKRTERISELNRKLETGFLASIKMMGTVAHRQQPQLVEHSKRTAALCALVAKELQFNERDILELQIAAYLHDIAESPEQSATLMNMIPNLGKAYQYVRQHCEKLDGSGVPNKFKKEEILLGSRILAVVNSYDEYLYLTAEGQAVTPSKAMAYLKEQAPLKLDAEVVAVLAKILADQGLLEAARYEENIQLYRLMPGMILARDLVSNSGQLIAPKELLITQEYLVKILQRQKEQSLPEQVTVYKNSNSQKKLSLVSSAIMNRRVKA